LPLRINLEEKRIVKYWEDSSQLVNDIKDSIHDIGRRRPGVGWIRGDQALDPTVYKELEDVRRQNKELQEKLDKLGNGDIVFPSELAHGGDWFKMNYTVFARRPNDTAVKKFSGNYAIPWDDLFAELVQLIYHEGTENQIQQIIQDLIKLENDIDSKLSVEISLSIVEQARYQFEALGLIVAVPKFGGYMGWTLTDKGRRYISRLKAQKRPAGP